MKRVINFLIICLASMNLCFAADCNTIITTSSSINKTDDCVLYSRNLEEILAKNLMKNFAGAKKLNNKIINITVKYSINENQNSKLLEKMALITDHTTIRLITKVQLTDSDNKAIWNNVYCKKINFETINKKNFTAITNYYEKLSQTITEEIKTRSGIQPIDYKQTEKVETPVVPDTTVEIHHETPKPEPVKNTNIKPQLQLQEDVSEKKTVTKQPEKKFNLKNIQLKLKSSTPQKEVKPEDIKTKPQPVQPTYTNIHVTPRKNSRNYTPKFDNSVNDI